MITKLQLRVAFWMAVGVWAAVLMSFGQPFSVSLFKPASIVLLVMIGVVTLFERWMWRWKWLRPWLVPVPNLIGSYRGEIRPSWIDAATQQVPPPIAAFLVIRQTLLTVSVRLYTVESDSGSVVASFAPFADGTLELVYSYRNEPRPALRSQSPVHYGSAKMKFDRSTITLTGAYWTDRATAGEMHFTRISRETGQSWQDCENLARS